MHYLSHELSQCGDERPDLVEVFRNLSKKFDGAYNLVFLNAMGDMVVLRDPNGFRPLCYRRGWPAVRRRQRKRRRCSTSASENIQSLEPGEMILIQDGEIRHRALRRTPQTPSHCFFEWIYFANVASTLDDRSVYLTPRRSGQGTGPAGTATGPGAARRATRSSCPVPDTGKAAADAMAYRAGRAVRRRADPQSLHRPHVHRRAEPRRARAAEVHAAARSAGGQARAARRGHDRPQHDDEVAAERSARRAAERKEIHVRVACPPIVAPCFYGIDMSTVRELFAPRFMKGSRITEAEQAAMAAELGADTLFYLPLEASPAASAWTTANSAAAA